MSARSDQWCGFKLSCAPASKVESIPPTLAGLVHVSLVFQQLYHTLSLRRTTLYGNCFIWSLTCKTLHAHNLTWSCGHCFIWSLPYMVTFTKLYCHYLICQYLIWSLSIPTPTLPEEAGYRLSDLLYFFLQ